MAGLIAVVTDGLGSTRLDIYDSESMRMLPRREGWSRAGEVIASNEGRLWFDWPDIIGQFMQELRAFERASEVERLVPVARGAVVGLFDRSGGLAPAQVEDYSGATRRGGVVSYFSMTDPATDEIINRMASPAERYGMYGVPPNFVGYAVPGWAIADLAARYPASVAEAGGVALGPELLARLVCGEATPADRSGLELTYLMCHTGLWKDGAWSALAEDIDRFVQDKTGRRLIGDLMPREPGRSTDIFDFAEPGQGPDGAPIRIGVLKGGHDSTFGDVPVVAAGGRAFAGRQFVHFQAGSWGMARVVGGEGSVGLPSEGFGKHVMYQADLDGRLVLTALAPTGIEFQNYGGEGPAGKGVFLRELGLDSLPARFDLETVRGVVAARAIFVTPGVAQGTGPFPDSASGVIGMDEVMADRSGGLAHIALNLMTSAMSVTSIDLVAPGPRVPVILSAGGAADPLFGLLMASLMPEREVYYIEDDSGKPVTETTSAGGFLVGLENLKGTPAYSIDVSAIGYKLVRLQPEKSLEDGLRAYRAEFEKLATGR